MIPAGFQLHIESWENDGDYRSTEIVSGLTDPDARFLISIAQEFTSCNRYDKPGLGNKEIDKEQLSILIREKMFDNPNISEEVRDHWSEGVTDEHAAYELICDELLGYQQEQTESSYSRVFESYQVFFFPCSIEDVTKNF